MSLDYCDLRQWVPCEFGRKPRSFAEFSSFKASEIKMLVSYIVPALFNEYVPSDKILHFNSLNYAYRILGESDEYVRNNDFADDLLKRYVIYFKDHYGPDHCIYKVHNMTHLQKTSFENPQRFSIDAPHAKDVCAIRTGTSYATTRQPCRPANSVCEY